MHAKHLPLLLCALWMASASICATTYYCSPTGNGSGAAYTAPCSFADGLALLHNPGDTLYLLGGQYDLLTTNIQGLSGSASRRIVISGYPGELAILDFRGTAYGKRGLQVASSCTYLHVKDLTLRYSGKNNLYNEGSYCLFEHLDIYGSADTGCQMKNGGNNVIKNVDSHDNFDYQNTSGGLADFGGNADGFADKQHSGAPNHYIGCRSWNNSDDGWDFYQRITTGETIIENCICYHNGPADYDMRGHARYNTDKAWFDKTIGSTITNRYNEQQVVTMEHYPNHGNGNGFKLGGGYTNHLVLVHHCLSVGNTVRGFDQNNNDGTMRLYNNTGYLNGVNFGFTTAYGTLKIQNNLSYQGRSGDAPKSKTTLVNSHNSWNGMAAAAADFQSVDTTLILLPRQADGSLAEAALMRLTAGSKFIDAGEVVGLIYYGLAPDLGCYEVEVGEPIDPSEPEPIYECADGAHPIAYVSLTDAAADKAILSYLRADDSLCVTICDAADPLVDYSAYELIILSPVPNSGAAGLAALQNSTKPRLILKPFLFKSGVWGWCTPANTTIDTLHIADPSHPVFQGLQGPLKLYSQMGKYGIATMSNWTISPVSTLATVGGNDAMVAYANTLTLGLSEYSTAYITQDGKTLLRNAVYYLLGRPVPTATEQLPTHAPARKVLHGGRIYLLRDGMVYTVLGEKVGNIEL